MPNQHTTMPSDKSQSSRLTTTRIFLILSLIAALALAALSLWWHLAQDATPNGLQRTHTGRDGYVREGNWLWASMDGDNFTNEDGLNYVDHVHMTGIVHVGDANTEQTWQVLHTGNVRVFVDDRLVFEDTDGPNNPTEQIITFIPQTSTVALRIEADVDINTARTVYPYRTQFGIYEPSFFGRWALLPPHKLYHAPPDSTLVNERVALAAAQRIAFFTLFFSGLGAIGAYILQRKLWRSRIAWIVLGITALSLTLRFIVMAERAASDPFFHFLVPAGDDNYVLMGKLWLSGEYALAGTFWPPAPIVYFAGCVWLLGAALSNIYIANILLSGIATAAVTLAGWHALDDKRVGIVAGLLFALYPPLIFYNVTTQSVVLDAGLVAIAVLFGVLAIRKQSFAYAALFGILISLAGMSRGTALLLGLGFFLGLLYGKNRADLIKGIQLTTVAAVCSLLTLAPQIAHNYSATGEWSLTPYSNGSLTLYSGNNRDADGIWTGRGAAWERERLSGADWNAAFAADFARDPVRVLQLNLRKLGIFFNNYEYVSNVNFDQQGRGESQLIATLSQNNRVGMALLSFFVWIGAALWASQRKPEMAFLLWSTLLMLIGTVLFVLAGRLRVPLMPLLMIAAATALIAIWDALRTRQMSRALLVGVSIAISLSVLMPLLDSTLPRQSYTTLPDDAITRDLVYADELRLLGFDPIQADLTPDGYVYITLYWEIIAPPSHDYIVAVELAEDTGRITGIDVPLASISYPPTPASQLRVGGIIREGYLLRLPDALPDIAHVNVAIYAPERDVLLTAPDGQPDTSPRATLFSIGITQPQTTDLPDTPNDTQVGDLLILRPAPFIAPQNDTLAVQTNIRPEQRIYEDYVYFIQVLDSAGNIVAQSDSTQLNDTGRTTSALIPESWFRITRTLTLPSDLPTGTYTVIAGFYRFPSLERLPLTTDEQALPDNVLPLGTITLSSD